MGAFSLVTSWDTRDKLVGAVTSEFSSVTSLAEDLGGIPSNSSREIAESLADYAALVRQTEIGTAGVVGPNIDSQKLLAVIEKSITAVAESPGLTAHQVDNLYAHMESVKDSRKDRLTISVPNLPVSINALLLVSAFCVLLGIGLYPASRVRWFTYLYGGATVVVATSLVVAVLSLQSPLQASESAAKPIDMFLTSMEQGGANIGLSDPKPTNPPK